MVQTKLKYMFTPNNNNVSINPTKNWVKCIDYLQLDLNLYSQKAYIKYIRRTTLNFFPNKLSLEKFLVTTSSLTIVSVKCRFVQWHQ